MEELTHEYEKVLLYIKTLVKEKKLKLGERIPAEREIAQTLSVSRNSTREALKILVGNGMIEKRRGSGNYLVCNASKSLAEAIDMMLLLKQTNMQEICEFRRYMEKISCEMLFAKEEELKIFANELRNIVGIMMRSTVEEQTEMDRIFHYALIEKTENQLFIALMKTVAIRYRSWIDNVLERTDDKEREAILLCHEKICKALEENNLKACLDAVDEHYDRIEVLREHM